MSLVIRNQPVPLSVDSDGVVRVAGTRVALETIVALFESGATAEEIAQRLPTVPLAAVYMTIAYYLHHAAEVTEYLDGRERQAEVFREECLARWDHRDLRARLLSRRSPDRLAR